MRPRPGSCELWRLQGVERFADGSLDATLPGGKHNLTDVAARIGLGQLARLEEFNARRRELARRYFECFDRSLGCELPLEDFTHSNWHMFQIVLPRAGRSAAISSAQMHAAGIGIGVHYPAIHLLTLYRQMGFKPGDFPIAEHIGARHRHAAAVPGDARRGRGSRVRADRTRRQQAISAACRHAADRSLATRSSAAPTCQRRHSRLQRGGRCCRACLRACIRRSMRSAAATRSCSSTMAAATARPRCCGSSSSSGPDVTRVVLFASNFGQHRAILAGFAHSRGRYVITLDADLQNPPEEIGRVLAELDAGHDYVGTIRMQRQDVGLAPLRLAADQLRFASAPRSVRITDQGCMFRGYARAVVDAVNQCSEYNTFVPALAYTFSMNPTEIHVAHEERGAGQVQVFAVSA